LQKRATGQRSFGREVFLPVGGTLRRFEEIG